MKAKETINTQPKSSRLYSLDMNNYVRPDYKKLYNTTGDYVFNGDLNNYYEFVEERYYGSPTNAAIINNYCTYIYGDGLFNNGLPVEDVLSKKDLQKFIKDFKIQGQAALQVIYTKDRKVFQLAYVPIKSVAIARQVEDVEFDVNDDPLFYWYSHDWNNQKKFTPVLLPAFGTSNEGTELLVVRNIDNLPYFSLPDYQSGLQYAQIEEELSNYFISHIRNGLSFGHVINVFGVEEGLESQDAAEKAFVRRLTGSGNAGKFVLSFQDDPTKATTIESIPVSDAHEQYTFLTTEARDKILMAHNVVNPILFGVDKGSGFSNNADEMVVALKTLYRAQINPMREVLLDALNEVLRLNDPNVDLYFEDFEDLRIVEETTTEVIAPEDNTDTIITE